MPNTLRGYPYPAIDEAPAGPFAFEQLADAVDADVAQLEDRAEVLEAATAFAEWTTAVNGLASNSTANVGSYTGTGRTNNALFATLSGGGVKATAAGTFTIVVTQKWSAAVGGTRAFVQLSTGSAGTGDVHVRNSYGVGEDTQSCSLTIKLAANEVVYPGIYQATGGVLNATGTVRVSRSK